MTYRTTRIYQRALQLSNFALMLEPTRPGFGFLVDQLRRAATSVALNYLEGCGRSTRADRARFFDIAIGSAYEVIAALDILEDVRLVDGNDCGRGQVICENLIAMLRSFR